MSSYNKINGTYTAERRDLLTTILRDEWGYKGFVMTDWGGGRNWTDEMNAGNDLIMPGRPDQIQTIISAAKHDSISARQLDANVEHILNVILKSPSFLKYPYTNKPDLKAHAEIARKAATEGIVLLKNEANTLPISNTAKTIAVFGNTAYNTIAGGTGSGDVNKAYVISVYKGLSNAGYQPNESLAGRYAAYFQDYKTRMQAASTAGNNGRRQQIPPAPEQILPNDVIADRANDCAIALITIGRNAGEGADRKLETNYMLIPEEKQQIKQIAQSFHAKGKKVVVVLNIGGVIDMNGWKDDADAILLAWQPSQEAGNAIADVLSGKVNPSGKLATTFPMQYTDVPSAKNFPGTPAARPEQVIYQEGIYVGYRYYDTFNVKPAYEFGYGLSYTTFSISNLKLSSAKFNGMITATATVKNTGKLSGKQVVQLYLSAPANTIDKPVQELKGFSKTRLLKPGESQLVTITIRAADLASYHTDTSQWIADAGEYKVNVGASSRDIKQTATFKVISKIVTETDHRVLQPQIVIDELKSAGK